MDARRQPTVRRRLRRASLADRGRGGRGLASARPVPDRVWPRRGGQFDLAARSWGVGRHGVAWTGDNAIDPAAREALRRFAAVVGLGGRRGPDQVPARDHHELEPGRRARVRLRRGGGDRPPDLILIPAHRRGEERQILRRVMGGEQLAHCEMERVHRPPSSP
jgi:hypothetical protein